MEQIKIGIILQEIKLGVSFSLNEVERIEKVIMGEEPISKHIDLVHKDTAKYRLLLFSGMPIKVCQEFDGVTGYEESLNVICGVNAYDKQCLHDITNSEEMDPIYNIKSLTKGDVPTTKILLKYLTNGSRYNNRELIQEVSGTRLGLRTIFGLEYNDECKKLFSELRVFNKKEIDNNGHQSANA